MICRRAARGTKIENFGEPFSFATGFWQKLQAIIARKFKESPALLSTRHQTFIVWKLVSHCYECRTNVQFRLNLIFWNNLDDHVLFKHGVLVKSTILVDLLLLLWEIESMFACISCCFLITEAEVFTLICFSHTNLVELESRSKCWWTNCSTILLSLPYWCNFCSSSKRFIELHYVIWKISNIRKN